MADALIAGSFGCGAQPPSRSDQAAGASCRPTGALFAAGRKP
jgi:hypothetical protein